MENEKETSNKITIPLAIVIAGALIAGAVMLSNWKNAPQAQSNNTAAQQEAAKAAIGKITIRPIQPTDHIQGNPKAPVTMFVYTDLECPYCKQYHTTMQALMANFGSAGKISWIYRDFPLVQLHSNAPKEAEASECVSVLGGNKAYWKFVDKIFQVTPSNNGLDLTQMPSYAKDAGVSENDFNACISANKYSDVVGSDLQEAMNTGGQGTPYTIFVVQNPLTKTQIDSIQKIAATFGGDIFTISDDSKMVAMSGALPTAVVASIINVLLGS